MAAKKQENRTSGCAGLLYKLKVARELADHFTASSEGEEQLWPRAEEPPVAESPYQASLEQLKFAFEAAEENARRHRETTRIIVGATVVLLSVGVFRFGLAAVGGGFSTRPAWIGTAVQILLILGLACMVFATNALIGPVNHRMRRRLDKLAKGHRIVSASVHLYPGKELTADLEEPPAGTAEHIRYQSFLSTLSALRDLMKRNSRRDAAIYRGRCWFRRGVTLILIAVAVYVGWYSWPKETHSLGGDGKGDVHEESRPDDPTDEASAPRVQDFQGEAGR